ncbi:glutamate dehydrogenase [bacterium]|nr:glutamate dehydrogenase [bacterium]
MMKKETGFYGDVLEGLHNAADLMKLDREVLKILTKTTNEIIVNFPVKMSNGRVEMFTGYRVQHNNVMGPYSGGLRFHPWVDLGEMRALATVMTCKAAIAGIPFGGAAGGIQFNPSDYNSSDVERITRRFTYSLGSNIGTEYDILTSDVNTNPQTMAWILDTYLSTMPPEKRQAKTHVVTGKPIHLGGSVGHDKAAGQGLVFAIEEWAAGHRLDLEGAAYTVQGFGSVGVWTSILLNQKGAKLVAVEDTSGPILNPDGIDPEDLFAYDKENGRIAGYPNAKPIDHEAFLATKADIFIPAALEYQITAQTAPKLNVKLVVEGADCPCDRDGSKILKERGIEVLPDILCNSGSVIVSYFEWLQNKRSELWELEEVDRKLQNKMKDAYHRVRDRAAEFKTDWCTAARIEALTRLERIYKRRGIFP